jgi:hypothetical protein
MVAIHIFDPSELEPSDLSAIVVPNGCCEILLLVNLDTNCLAILAPEN